MASEKTGFTSIQKWTLLSTILASSLVFIDSTALNVALPALQKDLGITGTELLWVINGYALFLSALLLVGGSLGDLYGRNKVFLIGLAIFHFPHWLVAYHRTLFNLSLRVPYKELVEHYSRLVVCLLSVRNLDLKAEEEQSGYVLHLVH